MADSGANEVDIINNTANLTRVTSGMKGGPFNQDVTNGAPALTFVDGIPKEVKEKLAPIGFTQVTPIDPWNERRR